MKKTSVFFLFLIISLGISMTANAAPPRFFWIDRTLNHLWADPDNWNIEANPYYGVPTAINEVRTYNANGLPDYILIQEGDTALCQDLILGEDVRSTTLRIDGGYLQFRNMFVGLNWGGDPPAGQSYVEVIINGGTVYSKFDGSFGGKIMGGYSDNTGSSGHIVQNGGEVILESALELAAYGSKFLYELKGGVFDAKWVNTLQEDPYSAKIDITYGTLVLDTVGNFLNDLVPYGYISVNGTVVTDPNMFNYDLDTYPTRVGIKVKNPPLHADLNNDKVIDLSDFAILAGEWLESREY